MVESWVCSVLVALVWSVSCLLRFEISSSRDSIVPDLEASWAFRSSIDEPWLGDASGIRRLDLFDCV
jgi:hypothetical protein